MRHIWISFIILPIAVATTWTSPVQVQSHAGFQLTNGYCVTAAPSCALQGPKPWESSEVLAVKQAIDDVAARPSGGDVLRRVQGKMVIRRFKQGARGGLADPAIAATYKRTSMFGFVEVYDRFFMYGDSRDIIAGRPGYRYQTQMFLHELMHALDKHSSDAEFHRAVGFVRAGSALRFSVEKPSEVEALSEWDRGVARLEQIGDYVAQRRLNRSLAMAFRPVRVPTLSSIQSPAEAFAEIGSHLILDDNAPRYLPARVVDYFSEQVGIRGAGRVYDTGATDVKRWSDNGVR